MHTVGGVINNGETIMQIVPRADELVVEAKVAPFDIDQIATGATCGRAHHVRQPASGLRACPLTSNGGCPYHPLHGIGEYRREHPWRKPNPGMILQAIFDFKLDPARCAIVGDKMSDIEPARRPAWFAGFVASRPCQNGGRRFPPHEVVADLSEALALLRSRFAAAAADQCSGRQRFNT